AWSCGCVKFGERSHAIARPRTKWSASLANRNRGSGTGVRLAAIGRVILHGNQAAFYWLVVQDRRRSSNVGPEISAEQVLDFIEAHGMILATTGCDLDCTHQGSEPASLRPVEARGQ